MQQESSEVSSEKMIADYLRLLKCVLAAPTVSALPLSTQIPSRDASRLCALVLSPHPDDECLTGALALRLLREQNWLIVNIAVTLGSNPARRAERKRELGRACAVLGFECVLPEENGFSEVTVAMRSADGAAWNKKVEQIKKIIAQLQPRAIIMPHAGDGHPTHIGTHFLGMDALAKMPHDFTCTVALTEYWQPMNAPNAIIGVGECDAATLMSALACHAGEVARNAYDKRFPAFLIDAVRRSERLGDPGKTVPAMDFAQMIRLGVWMKSRFVPSALNRFVSVNESVGYLFE